MPVVMLAIKKYPNNKIKKNKLEKKANANKNSKL